MIVHSSSTFVTPNGPRSASDLEAGSEVLCIAGGMAVFLKLSSARTLSGSAVWVLSGCGDVVLGNTSSIVTLSGMRSCDELLAMRSNAHFGRSKGSWPSLEVPHLTAADGSARHVGSPAGWNFVASRLLELIEVSTLDDVWRVGSHESAVLKEFSRFASGASMDIEVGPAGWSWLRRRTHKGGQSTVAIAPSKVKEVTTCVSALWQPLDDSTFSLPIEYQELRWFALTLLRASGIYFTTSYKPMYSPSSAQWSAVREHAPGARIFGVTPVSHATLVDLRLPSRGVYGVVNGLLIT